MSISRGCPSRAVLNLVAGRWTALIIGSMETGPRRFGEIRRQLDGITQKVLTDKLRRLERDGILKRTVVERPLEVHYELTPLGLTLIGPLAAIRAWAEEHIGEVDESRASYDGDYALA
ncbi:helix-turn-helix domain-containing protein [Aeromicrobium sp.]|uniref:winged helix-turn-helix transcriptional regulator n=1 Tax=Aeromicrobium sp. TaxID=1871063 RepID=UPI0030C183F4